EPEATEPQQLVALSSLVVDAGSLLNRVKGLDSRSRRRLLSEYGAEGDSEGDALLALGCLAQDVTALDRLCQNLMVATQRLSSKAKGKPGAPTISFERFAAEKLLRVCRAIYGSAYLQPRSAERKASQRFVIRALMMICVAQSSARTAANDALANAEKLPSVA